MIQTTCTDCTRSIEIDEKDATFLLNKARLCDGCKQYRVDTEQDPADISPATQMGNCLGNYAMNVELQWAISPEDLEYRAIGDCEEDFARRSMESVRSSLSLVSGGGHNVSPIGHYHLGEPKRVLGPPGERPQGFTYQYHMALNRLAGLVWEFNESVGLSPTVDLSEAFVALAVGARQGWPVSPVFADQVHAHEDGYHPLSEKEAKKRMGL